MKTNKDNCCFYQIYPLGFCGAPKQQAGIEPKSGARINKVIDWIPHIKKLGADTVLFNPVFNSSSHGYDTANFGELDLRLGTNCDFEHVCEELHCNGLNVMLDGVFNHVGRDFWAFIDLRKKRQDSQYKDWFIVNFDGNSNYDDGFWYEGWEGHFELVKLNLNNPDVVNHIFSNIKFWIEKFGIDGLRLDVAYCLSDDFIRSLRKFCNSLDPSFMLIGEVLFGDYNRIVSDEMLHSCTNYECYKGLFSSLNSDNLFELTYSLNRQFGSDSWCLYKGLQLLSFADNHDVSRLATIITDPKKIPLAYALLFSMPGIPCIYYGSEWGAEGCKADGDDALRQSFDAPVENELFAYIAKLVSIRSDSKALQFGNYKNIVEQNTACLFERCFENERVVVGINLSDNSVTLHSNILSGAATELISNTTVFLNGCVELIPKSACILRFK